MDDAQSTVPVHSAVGGIGTTPAQTNPGSGYTSVRDPRGHEMHSQGLIADAHTTRSGRKPLQVDTSACQLIQPAPQCVRSWGEHGT